MFNHLVTSLEPLLTTYGAFGVFVSSIIEEIIAPIPSTLVVFTASVLLTHGKPLSEALLVIAHSVMLPAAAGITIGSLVPYAIARWGEKIFIDRCGKYFGISWSTIERAHAWTKKSSSDQWLVFCTRAIPGIPSLMISLSAGLLRMPVLEYVLWSFLGTLIRAMVLGIVGYLGGMQVLALVHFIGGTENAVLVAAVTVGIAFLGFFTYQLRRQRKAPLGR